MFFKKRWYNHTRSFRDPALRKATSLAKLVFELNEKGIGFEISWKIIRRAYPYSGGGGGIVTFV